MSTRSRIAIKQKDNTYKSIYCHCDGYPKYNGVILYYHYSDPMKIKLLFSKEVKDAIKDYNLHPTQKMKQNPDGTTTVSLEAGGRYEICWHLFRWGENVKILEPQELKDTYKELLDKAIKQI